MDRQEYETELKVLYKKAIDAEQIDLAFKIILERVRMFGIEATRDNDHSVVV